MHFRSSLVNNIAWMCTNMIQLICNSFFQFYVPLKVISLICDRPIRRSGESLMTHKQAERNFCCNNEIVATGSILVIT